MSAVSTLSRVRRWHGAVTWYLEGDGLLAADQRLFTMYYRRIELADIASVVLWPTRTYLIRAAIWIGLTALPALLIWWLHLHRTAEALIMAGAICALIEIALGPRCRARIAGPQGGIELPLVARWRQAAGMQARLEALLAGTGATAPVSIEEVQP